MDYRSNQAPGAGQPTSSMRPPVGYGTQGGYAPQGEYGQTMAQPPEYAQPAPGGYTQQFGPQGDYQPPMQGPAGYTQQQPYPPQMNMPQDGFAPPTGFQPPVPPVQPPRRPNALLKALQVICVALVLGAAVWYLYELLVPDALSHATIQAGMLGARYTGDCIIVRDETPFDAEGVTSVDYQAEEGSLVHRGADICYVYSSGYSTSAVSALAEYREDIRDYQMNLLESETTYDAKMARVQNDVLTRAKEVRDMIGGARGSMTNQEMLLDAAIDARELYLKSKYSDDQRLSRLYDDERSQVQRIDSWTKTYAATGEGIVSFYSDGYEYGLTSANYSTFTPREVRNMFNGQQPEKTTAQKGKTTIYRMVKDGAWNVLFLAKDTDWNPVQGQTYELLLERFENTQVYATVESFTRSGGELLVCLRVESPVKPVLYMRTCEAELGESVSTLMVPQRAIYTQDDMKGVVVVDGSTESFIPVDIIWEQDGSVYINAVQQGLLLEGMTVKLF